MLGDVAKSQASYAWMSKAPSQALISSVDLDRLTHDMRMRGVPREHTDWMVRRYEGRTSRICFDGYMSDPYNIVGGLDQGAPESGYSSLI